MKVELNETAARQDRQIEEPNVHLEKIVCQRHGKYGRRSRVGFLAISPKVAITCFVLINTRSRCCCQWRCRRVRG